MPSNKKNKPLDDIDDADDVPLRTDHEDDDEEEWEDFDDDEEEWIDDLDDDDDDEFDSDDEVPGGSSRTKFPKNNKPETDLYAVLGLTKQATQEEIAKSYRRQALKFHPDRNPEGAETFKKLTAAYEVLSDANARKRYDRTGQVGDGAGDVDIDEVSRSREIQDMLEHFMNAFRYSEDEVEELKKAFVEGRGLLEATLDNFPWTNDEGELERIVDLVNTHIIDNTSNGDTATSSKDTGGGAIVSIDEKFKATWKKSATPSKVQSLSKKLDKERKEAEAILAEILAARHGDDNNNNDKKKNKNKKNPMMITAGKNTSGSASSSASTSARQPKNAAASSSSSSTAVAKGSSSSTQLMLPSLASLRENAKKSFFDNIADLEAKYGGTKNGGGGGGNSNNKKAKKETKRK